MSAGAIAGRPPLALDEAAWAAARERALKALGTAARARGEVFPQVFAVVAAAARAGTEDAPELVAQVRRVLVRAGPASEMGLRCQRVLARVGGPVDVETLSRALVTHGRPARIALAAIGDAAVRGSADALEVLVEAIDGPLRTDAASVLGHFASEEALDALAPHVRSPGHVGLQAASALLGVEDDAIAFESLCERLCDPSECVGAVRALAAAAPEARWVREAECLLSRWARRGVTRAEPGRLVAAAELSAGGWAGDVEAMMRALSSADDELVLLGARAAYALGDSERARGSALRLLRRGPASASAAFALLTAWADLGDGRAETLVRHVLRTRPVDVGRAATFEALAAARRPALVQVVSRALESSDAPVALEAARAVARLFEPPAILPPTWL